MGTFPTIPIPYHWAIEIWNALTAILSCASNFGKSKEFLIQVLAFEGIILTVAVPLSLEMISRVSERYQSNVVTRQFRRRRLVTLLPPFLLFKVTAIILLLFFAPDGNLDGQWKALGWVTFVLFLVVVLLVIGYYRVLSRYMSEESSKAIVEGLIQDASKTLQK